MPSILASAEITEINIEIAKIHHDDPKAIRHIYKNSIALHNDLLKISSNSEENKERKMSKEDKKVYAKKMQNIKQIWLSISKNPITPNDVIDELVHIDQIYWKNVIKLPKISTQTIDYIVRYLRHSFKKIPHENAILEAALEHPNLSEQSRAHIIEMLEYDQLIERVEDPSTTTEELMEIATICANITDNYSRIGSIVAALTWHDNATSQVIHTIAHSDQTIALYCTARSDLADANTLLNIVRKLPHVRKVNRVFYDAIVIEIIRNSNHDNAVLQELVSISSDTWTLKCIFHDLVANAETLTMAVDKAYNLSDRDNDFTTSMLHQYFNHPNRTPEYIAHLTNLILQCKDGQYYTNVEKKVNWEVHRFPDTSHILDYEAQDLIHMEFTLRSSDSDPKFYTQALCAYDIVDVFASMRYIFHYEWLSSECFESIINKLAIGHYNQYGVRFHGLSENAIAAFVSNMECLLNHPLMKPIDRRMLYNLLINHFQDCFTKDKLHPKFKAAIERITTAAKAKYDL